MQLLWHIVHGLLIFSYLEITHCNVTTAVKTSNRNCLIRTSNVPSIPFRPNICWMSSEDDSDNRNQSKKMVFCGLVTFLC